MSSGNLLEFNRSVNAFILQIEGYNRAVSELRLPSGLKEIDDIRNLELSLATKFLEVLKELQASIQSGSSSSVQISLNKFIALTNDPSIDAGREILEKLLTTYSIPDAEVNYRRQ